MVVDSADFAADGIIHMPPAFSFGCGTCKLEEKNYLYYAASGLCPLGGGSAIVREIQLCSSRELAPLCNGKNTSVPLLVESPSRSDTGP